MICTGKLRADKPGKWENGFLQVEAKDAVVTNLGCDPAGKASYQGDFLRSFSFDHVYPTSSTVMSRVQGAWTGYQWNGLAVYIGGVLPAVKTTRPVELEKGNTLSQAFVAEHDFEKVTIRVPTWETAGSAFTLQLLSDGKVVAQKRIENVPDNSEPSLSFEPLPAGRYLVRMAEPKGRIGWWCADAKAGEDGLAFVNDEPDAATRRAFSVTYRDRYGTAEAAVLINRNKLRYTLAVTPRSPERIGSHPQRLAVRWIEGGYDTSWRAVPFKRFYSDTQRFLPVEQLKRNSYVDLGLTSVESFHIDGTGKFDLEVRCPGGSLGWGRTPDTLTVNLNAEPVPIAGGKLCYEREITVVPREDKFPADWPQFTTSNPALDRDLNLLHYERNFSYPPGCSFSSWIEWSALTRAWFDGPLKQGELSRATSARMDDEGYVQVNDAWRGWPFPDNARYDTRHFENNPRYILGFWRHYLWDRDPDLLRKEIGRLRSAMEFLLKQMQGEKGLMVSDSKDITGKHQGVGSNYWDILPFGYLDAYANTSFYGSLEAMAQLESLYAALPLASADKKKLPPARAAEFYSRLRQLCKQRYMETFWDDKEGRFIGCVDKDGGRHDYGFTFVNLEAMYYGLASPEQVRRIYHWMENGRSSAGKQDIYSAWIFAPRANTIHDPEWDEQHPDSKEGGSVKAWWHFGWHGTRYGDQCQDGGAILYTSFFDLMARSTFLGADNAYDRWHQILARYRMPDRLCGGPPLSRGENPQQLNPGSVGLDIPFPESGLVPLWFLYGVMGLEPTPQGLRIKPNLPDALQFCQLSNVSYRHLPLTIRVTRKEARISCQASGYEFKQAMRLGPDGSCTLSGLPGGKAFPEKPLRKSRMTGSWIWTPDQGNTTSALALFRKKLTLVSAPQKATLSVAVDNTCRVVVNGKEAGTHALWQIAKTMDITGLLHAGENVICIEAMNGGGPAGLLLMGTIRMNQTEMDVQSDSSWKCSRVKKDGWEQPGFDDSAWEPGMELGAPPVAPWGEIAVR